MLLSIAFFIFVVVALLLLLLLLLLLFLVFLVFDDDIASKVAWSDDDRGNLFLIISYGNKASYTMYISSNNSLG